MSLSAITANSINVASTQAHESAAPAAAAKAATPSLLPTDTVSLSAAARKVSVADVDHDGDSH